jgi:hypothetical protein
MTDQPDFKKIGIVTTIIITVVWIMAYMFKYSSLEDWYIIPAILTIIAIPMFLYFIPSFFSDTSDDYISPGQSLVAFGILMEHIWAFTYLYTIITNFTDWTQIPIVVTIVLINIYTWIYLIFTRKNSDKLFESIIITLFLYGITILIVGGIAILIYINSNFPGA